MKIVDIILALGAGWLVNWIAFDFLKEYGIDFGIWRWGLRWVLPLLALAGLYATYFIGKRFLFVFQAGKFFLIGAAAAVIDIKIYQFLAWAAPFFIAFATVLIPLVSKAISFLISTSAKYWFNKHWAFQKPEKDDIKREVYQFFLVTLAGLILDVASFWYFAKVMGAQITMPVKVWTELSIIFAALIAAVWNFTGYKFLVFKK